MQDRIVMLADLDYFYAQCEEVRNPALRKKPVVICVYSGRTEDSGVVSTANYIARSYGVGPGIPIYAAKRKLKEKDAVFLPVDHIFYSLVSERVMTILKGHTDLFEQVGIDEAYLEVSNKVMGELDHAVELAKMIKTEIRSREGLTCSIGIGPNKLIAKMAADFTKPDGLTLVGLGQVQQFLFPLEISRLIGVGKRTSEKMQTLGISTIGDLARYDLGQLMNVFGRRLGRYFHDASNGIDYRPVKAKEQLQSISRISTLKEDTRDLETIEEKIEGLCDQIGDMVLREDLLFRSIGITFVANDLSIHSRSRTLQAPTNQLRVLKKIARDLIRRFLNESEIIPRRVGVRVANLKRRHGIQVRLMDPESNRAG